MKKLTSLSFLIPTYNDEQTIATAIDDAYTVGKRVANTFDIDVIDDGSRDKTGSVLRSLKKKYNNLHVDTHVVNKGYGATIRELYYKGKGEWLFSIPGDYQIHARQIEKFLPIVDQYDMIIGWRVSRQDPPGRLLQSALYNKLLLFLFNVSFHDVNSVKLMRRVMMDQIHLKNNSAFVDAELVIAAHAKKFRITEVPIEHSASVKAGGGGSVLTIFPTMWDMIKFKQGIA